jgi:hypothetical protein
MASVIQVLAEYANDNANVFLSIRLSTWKNLAPTRWIFMKFHI